jgi:hypothetical protein
MSKNPIVNGLVATLYIVVLVLVMTFGIRLMGPQDTFMTPIAMICLFTLSAAVMGYVFCYQPIMLFVEGKKKQAVQLFLQTVAVFGIITLVVLGLLFTRVIA